MTPDNERPELIRVGGLLKRVRLAFRPAEPPDGPVGDGPLVRVGGPLKRLRLTFRPAPPVVTVLELPLVGSGRGEQTFAVLRAIIEKVNEIEALHGRAGVWVDAERSGVREEKVEIVLASNNPSDAIEARKCVATILGEAIRNKAA